MRYRNTLEFDKVLATIRKLSLRIKERLPESSLYKTSDDFYNAAFTFQSGFDHIVRPNYFVRFICLFVIMISICGIAYGFTLVELKVQNTLLDVATFAEASINNILLIGAAYFFLFNLEKRIKRRRAAKYLDILSEYVHVVDMHQLAKDPHVYGKSYAEKTNSSPYRMISKFEFQRYLVYCSELLSLISKVSVLFSETIDDDIISKRSDEIENLSSQLTSKIWQKLIILQRIDSF